MMANLKWAIWWTLEWRHSVRRRISRYGWWANINYEYAKRNDEMNRKALSQ